ncbi:tRNA adenosine(34) deaminase TadA [Thalassoglobus polymorphus]|nr:tRNA adenosine(34) deaminase TadA [Thalassoglobus polymorphus]
MGRQVRFQCILFAWCLPQVSHVPDFEDSDDLESLIPDAVRCYLENPPPLTIGTLMFEPTITLQQIHEYWMMHAIDQAQRAFEQDEVPVGAVVVHEDRVIGEGYNQRESLNDPTAHAEMIAITQAAEELKSWRLLNCTLYVTLEPCPMCAGAIVQSRIPRLVYGTMDPKGGACNSLYQITDDARLNHRVNVTADVHQLECQTLLKEFFAIQRAKGKK